MEALLLVVERGPTMFARIGIMRALNAGGDVDHIKVFSTVDAAETWFEENDPEGVAFEYDVIGPPA